MPLRLTVNSSTARETALEMAIEHLRLGRIVLYPTDTLYGLAVDPRLRDALQRLYQVKGERGRKPFPLIAASADQVDAVAKWTKLGERLANRFWPGPLTLIFPTQRSHALGYEHDEPSASSSVAIRVPDAPVARDLARLASHPITATSANRSGANPCETVDEALDTIGAEIAVALDEGRLTGSPSTIVDVTGNEPVLIREGVLPWVTVVAAC